jgi:REP element-mobilizing transposase RayT
MARRPRLSGSELYHHIYAWGNDRHPIFKTAQHYGRYLKFLGEYAKYYQIDVIAYALMECHVHLFIFDPGNRLSEFMNSLHGEYAQYYNKVNHRVGHVFGERFNNKIVQPNNYGLRLSRYIHRQAVEAGIVDNPLAYPWTSYQIYLGLKPPGFVKSTIILAQFGDTRTAREQYQIFVMNNDNDPVDWQSKTASVIGDESFKDKIAESEQESTNQQMIDKAVITKVINELKITPEILLNPIGWEERRKRHEAFQILIKKYGLKASVVAREFKITTRAVTRALK